MVELIKKNHKPYTEMNKNINRSVVISTQQQWNPHSFCAPFSKIEHMEGNKTSHNTLKSNELVHSMWSDHNGITLQINNKKKCEKSSNINYKYIILNSSLIKEIRGKIDNILKWLKMKIQHMIYLMNLKQCLEENL